MKNASGVVNRQDMDLTMNEPIDNSVGTLNHFSNGGIVHLWNHTPGLREGRQSFYRNDQSLDDKLSVVGRVLLNEPSH